MKRPWMPLYVADFQMDTLGLDAAEIGVYMTLLCIAWRHGTGSVTGDMDELKNLLQRLISGFHGHSFNRIVPKLLEEFFEFLDGAWYQKRVVNELQMADKRSAKQSQNANKRWSEYKKNKELENAAAMPSQSQSQSHIEKKEYIRAVATATRPTQANEDFEIFWKVYPKRDGANPKAPARKAFLAAVKSGTEPPAIVEGAKRYAAKERERIGTPYIAQALTWLRQRRWEDYTQTTETQQTGWQPGKPTSEELRKKYGQGREAIREDASDNSSVVENGARLWGTQQQLVSGEKGKRGTQSLANILWQTPVLSEILDIRRDDIAMPVAGMVARNAGKIN